MFWFKNFRIRRQLCTIGCDKPSLVVVVKRIGDRDNRTYYCADHKHMALYWAREIGAKSFHDTGAPTR